MKKKLIATVVVIIALLAAVTAVLAVKVSDKDDNGYGKIAVELNEIEQLIEKGEFQLAAGQCSQLRDTMTAYVPRETDNTAYFWIVFLISAIIIIGVFVYIWFAILRPFEKLSDFAERIAGGDFDLPLNYERTDYFGKFTWAFDSMRKEVSNARACEKEAIENNKTVIASLSHDLKTPVASIRAYAEGLEAGLDMNPEKRARYLGVIMKKCDEVAELTSDMLMHSISDLEKLKMNPSELELCGFVKSTVSELSVTDDIVLSMPSYNIDVKIDPVRFTQVIENIVSNVRKYAKTRVEISAVKSDGKAVVIFRDYGKGIPDEEIPFIFDKFYRGTGSGNENGAGLGLHIVKYIVTQSDGEVYAENLSDGFMIKIILPLIQK